MVLADVLIAALECLRQRICGAALGNEVCDVETVVNQGKRPKPILAMVCQILNKRTSGLEENLPRNETTMKVFVRTLVREFGKTT